MSYRWIVYKNPSFSPGDYYGVQSNIIGDILGIFRSEESANSLVNKIYDTTGETNRVIKITWEE